MIITKLITKGRTLYTTLGGIFVPHHLSLLKYFTPLNLDLSRIFLTFAFKG